MTQKLVLIVDDDPDFAAISGEILQKAGYAVRHELSAGAALEVLQQGAVVPDLIISDLMMERDDAGFRFCHAVRKLAGRLAQTPILMLTAVARARAIPFDLKSPAAREWIKADDFAEKPIRKETLLAKVRHLLSEPADGAAPAPGHGHG